MTDFEMDWCENPHEQCHPAKANSTVPKGFLNFLRQFISCNSELTVPETAICGARAWNRMPQCDKMKFGGSKKCPPRGGRSSRSSKKRKKKKKKCIRPGPMTKNGYLNFLREFRRKHCGMSGKQAIVAGAKAWQCLPRTKKRQYQKEAMKVKSAKRPSSKRKRRRC